MLDTILSILLFLIGLVILIFRIIEYLDKGSPKHDNVFLKTFYVQTIIISFFLIIIGIILL